MCSTQGLGIVFMIHMVFNFIYNDTILYLFLFEIRDTHVSFCLYDSVQCLQKNDTLTCFVVVAFSVLNFCRFLRIVLD